MGKQTIFKKCKILSVVAQILLEVPTRSFSLLRFALVKSTLYIQWRGRYKSMKSIIFDTNESIKGVSKTQTSKTQTSDPKNSDPLGVSKTQTLKTQTLWVSRKLRPEKLRPSGCLENSDPKDKTNLDSQCQRMLQKIKRLTVFCSKKGSLYFLLNH